MRILYLSISDPGDFSSGGNQRSNHLREALLRVADVDTIVVGHEGPSSICPDWGDERVLKVNISPDAGRWEKRRLRAVARRMIASADTANAYDFIVARYFRTAVLVPPNTYSRLVVDGDDLRQTGSGQSLSRRIFVFARAVLIRMIARRASHIWLVDARDRAAVPGARVSMLPNTAKPPRRTTPSPRAVGGRILMVGTFPYPPNEEGLIWFTREVLPDIREAFPGAELHAVGRYYNRALDDLGDAVRMRGFVDDLDEEYGQADVVICPIFSGSGTQIKVVEALMNGRPTVVSDFAFQGFSDVLTPGDHLLVARDRRDWVRHCLGVLRDPARFAGMTSAGREAAERAYSVEAFSERVVATFRS